MKLAKSKNKKQSEEQRARRGALFKQKLEELHVTHSEFTDLINKKIKNHTYRLSDSKKISDWISNGIPGPRTPMKARMRQLAVIEVFGLTRNSDHHKMLDGRLPIPMGLLDQEQVSPIPIGSAEQSDTASKELRTRGKASKPNDAGSVEKGKLPTASRTRASDAPTGKMSGLYASIVVTIMLFMFGAVGIGYGLQNTSVPKQMKASKGKVAKVSSFITCPQEKTYRSSPSTSPAVVEVVNKLDGSPTLTATWIDFQGKHIDYIQIGAEPVELSTYTGHGWLIKDAQGKCFSDPYFASNQTRQYIIR